MFPGPYRTEYTLMSVRGNEVELFRRPSPRLAQRDISRTSRRSEQESSHVINIRETNGRTCWETKDSDIGKKIFFSFYFLPVSGCTVDLLSFTRSSTSFVPCFPCILLHGLNGVSSKRTNDENFPKSGCFSKRLMPFKWLLRQKSPCENDTGFPYVYYCRINVSDGFVVFGDLHGDQGTCGWHVRRLVRLTHVRIYF